MSKLPSLDEWISEAKKSDCADKCGMFLFHNGVVRSTSKAKVRLGDELATNVIGMDFDYDNDKVNSAIDETMKLPGIFYVRVWLNRGELKVGEDIMLVLVGGDIRPHIVDALNFLVGELKSNCVTEREIY